MRQSRFADHHQGFPRQDRLQHPLAGKRTADPDELFAHHLAVLAELAGLRPSEEQPR